MSDSFEQHVEHIQRFLQRYDEWNLRLKFSKCLVAQESLVFLGFKVTREGIEPNPDKMKTLRDAPRPGDLRDYEDFWDCRTTSGALFEVTRNCFAP